MPLRSIARMMRAFFLATAAIVRLTPRRSRNALIHRLSASDLPAAGFGTWNQQGSQGLIAALFDAHQDLLVLAGTLPWGDTHPGSQMPAVLELGTISDCRDHCRRCFGSNGTDARDTLAGGI